MSTASAASPHDDRGRIADLEQLLEVARRLGATVDLDLLLEGIAAAATSVLDCERATVFLYDRAAEELFSRLATGIADSPISEIRFPVTRGIAGEVARSGSVVNLPDAYADPRFNPEFDRRSGFRTRTLLTVPLSDHDGGIVGVLQVLNKRTGSFGDRDEQMALFLGSQAGVAVQRQMLLGHFAEKQRIQRDLNIARDIQQGLLPKEKPTLAGFDIAGWNRPADETGGDFYDFLPLADGGLAITIADVTGHGIGPALVVAEVRALFRALVMRSADLGSTVEGVHQLLCQDLPEGKFVTALFGILSPAEQTLRYVSTGQGPLLIYTAATGEVTELETQGLPLGILPEAAYDPPATVSFAPGDMLVLLTDGFFEWSRADGEQFGTERVRDLICTHRHRTAAELISLLHRSVVEFSAGTPQGDDLTAVIVKRLGMPAA
jgi:sigma-B regulation protein RsbU (phosphoserine phosphatase)